MMGTTVCINMYNDNHMYIYIQLTGVRGETRVLTGNVRVQCSSERRG